MIVIVIVAGSLYLVIITMFFYGWERLKSYAPTPRQFHSVISIIVPMRNEETNTKQLLSDIQLQNYPSNLTEIIVVDDHSTDNSLLEAKSISLENYHVISLPENLTGKKAALNKGIEAATGEIIITTDADCRVSKTWLSTIASYFNDFAPTLLLGPVCGISNSFFGNMQALEILSLQGSTAGSAAIGHAVMSNGANIAFPKSIYGDIQHIYNETKTQSGDDMFLMHEIKRKYPQGIHYLKSINALVYTKLTTNLSSFLNQRKRWTSKAKFYTDTDTIVTASIVLLMNATLLGTIIYGICMSDFMPFIILFITKCSADFVFLARVTSFFRKKRLMWLFPIVQSFYFLYICYTVLSAIFSTTLWKDRTIKH